MENDQSLPNTLSLSFHGINAKQLVNQLSDRLAFSTGSACHEDTKHQTMSTKKTILVQGGCGHAGQHIVRRLLNAFKGRDDYRIIGGFTERHEKNVPELNKLGVECVKLDLNEPELLDEALKGVNCVVMIPPYLPNREQLCNRFIDKCFNAGVKHVFLLSITAAPTQTFNFAKQLYNIEKQLMNSTMKYTIIRTPMFQQSTLMQREAIKTGSFFVYGEPKVPLACLTDIGDVIGKIAANPELGENRIFDITGPELLTANLVTKTFTEKLGRPVNCINVSKDQWKEKMKSFGFQDYKVDSLGEYLEWYSSGNGRVTNDFSKLMGREPRTFEQFVETRKSEILA